MTIMTVRRHRRILVLLFVLLLCGAGAQRRLADLDFATPGAPLFENDEALDGDEVAAKFLVLHEVHVPPAPAPGPAIEPVAAERLPAHFGVPDADPETPRAPPVRTSVRSV